MLPGPVEITVTTIRKTSFAQVENTMPLNENYEHSKIVIKFNEQRTLRSEQK